MPYFSVTYNGHGMHEFVPHKTVAYISQNNCHIGPYTYTYISCKCICVLRRFMQWSTSLLKNWKFKIKGLFYECIMQNVHITLLFQEEGNILVWEVALSCYHKKEKWGQILPLPFVSFFHLLFYHYCIIRCRKGKHRY